MNKLTVENTGPTTNEENTEIVVTAPGGGGGGGDSGGDGGGGGGTGGGGGGSGYSNAAYSAAANTFADQHLQIDGTSPTNAVHANHLHDLLAAFFDYANVHDQDRISIGNGVTIRLGDALASLDGHAMFHLTDSLTATKSSSGSNTGAVTHPRG